MSKFRRASDKKFNHSYFKRRKKRQSGQALVEAIILFSGFFLLLSFLLIPGYLLKKRFEENAIAIYLSFSVAAIPVQERLQSDWESKEVRVLELGTQMFNAAKSLKNERRELSFFERKSVKVSTAKPNACQLEKGLETYEAFLLEPDATSNSSQPTDIALTTCSSLFGAEKEELKDLYGELSGKTVEMSFFSKSPFLANAFSVLSSRKNASSAYLRHFLFGFSYKFCKEVGCIKTESTTTHGYWNEVTFMNPKIHPLWENLLSYRNYAVATQQGLCALEHCVRAPQSICAAVSLANTSLKRYFELGLNECPILNSAVERARELVKNAIDLRLNYINLAEKITVGEIGNGILGK